MQCVVVSRARTSIYFDDHTYTTTIKKHLFMNVNVWYQTPNYIINNNTAYRTDLQI